jgi:hypothetical protein
LPISWWLPNKYRKYQAISARYYIWTFPPESAILWTQLNALTHHPTAQP